LSNKIMVMSKTSLAARRHHRLLVAAVEASESAANDGRRPASGRTMVTDGKKA
jgi:hypothetical protein